MPAEPCLKSLGALKSDFHALFAMHLPYEIYWDSMVLCSKQLLSSENFAAR